MGITRTPVVGIGLSCKNITGEAVLLDDYKLYPAGVAADFELYDAVTGMKLVNPEESRERDTAYRLSWMNATKYEKVYSIIAEYSDGTSKVVEEIKMAPGTDYVATGVVEVKDGQTVKVYARNDSQPEPEDTGKPGTNKPDTTNPEGDNTVLLIVVIAVAVVLLAGIVVAVVLLTKKPAKKKKKSAKKATKKVTDNKTTE
jgi:hypothetical protein